MNRKTVFILDFGSQYTQLIARRVRELHVYCEILPYDRPVDLSQCAALILSGSPFSVREDKALHVDLTNVMGKVPILAVCYGAQYVAHTLGGLVERSSMREYGRSDIRVTSGSHDIFHGIPNSSTVWMSHADTIGALPSGFEAIASTEHIPIAAFCSTGMDFPLIGLQFHPEVSHTSEGKSIISNFLFRIVGLAPNWTPDVFVDQAITSLKDTIGQDQVILGLSGGVDSSVAAVLLHRAIGSNLHGIFVNNGLLRENEYKEVLVAYEGMGLNVKGVDASQLFLDALKGVTDPENKRKIIGRVFVEVFEAEAKKIEGAKWLAQGTIYPDVIESVSVHGPSVTIKSHHNVGGLPEKLSLKIVEPLRALFKDEVRLVGKTLDISEAILNRHPFPGPGLAIRILGEITEENVKMLQKADRIYIDLLKKHGWYERIWQAGAILLPVFSVGVMGDERTYEQAVALRAVTSLDGMTAEWSQIPYDLLAEISTHIINQVTGINRVVYDISTKPPATIEWE